MEARQRKSRRIVIEGGRLPRCSRVAKCAIGRESNLRVVRARSGLVIGQVAGNASRYGQAVIVVDVATRARNRCMKTSQRETCCRVIEYRSRPGCGRVAERTVGRERRRNMVWHHASESRGALPGSDVATVAGR